MTEETEGKVTIELVGDVSRREFFSATAKFGMTTALVAATAGTLGSSAALAQTAMEEKGRQSAAKHTMTIGTAYRIGTTRSYPIMQLNLKENIQNLTNGQVYVKLGPAGQLGVGTKLAQKVQSGTIQAAQHSLSNFAPFAPAVDMINLPYWCGENQRFVNLVTSDIWQKAVVSRVRAKGFKPLFFFCIDPRTAAKRRGLDDKPFKTPDDLKGIKFRVPGSKILQQFYRLLGANATPVAWGETPTAIKQGVADALDPAVEALYAFGFKDILSWVTFNRSVPDSQVYSCNLAWFESLPKDVQEGIDFASEVTFAQNLAQVPASRAFDGDVREYFIRAVDNLGATMNYPSEAMSGAYWRLAGLGVTISRLAHGVPVGGELDYLDDGTLSAALKARRPA